VALQLGGCADTVNDDDAWQEYGWCEPVWPEVASYSDAIAWPYNEGSIWLQITFVGGWDPAGIVSIEGAAIDWQGTNRRTLTARLFPEPMVASLALTVELECDGRGNRLRYRLNDPHDLPADGRELEPIEP